ncbi:MAG: DUF222 domain-containing protein, partial [Actinobacteria bacterium]|nr:DUF222 domain-containing protein [Actinomycetota bacterium]
MFDELEALEWAAKIAGLHAGAGSDDDLCAAAVAIEAVRSLLDAGQAKVLAELHGRGVCDREFGLATSSWLAREASLPGHLARSQVRVARKLAELLPEVAAALQGGRIGWQHAKTLADACNERVADAVAGLQGELLDMAEHCSVDRWRRDVADIVELLDQDGGYDPNRDLARNELHLSKSLDGLLHLHG